VALYSPSGCESCVSSVSSPTLWNVTKEGYKKNTCGRTSTYSTTHSTSAQECCYDGRTFNTTTKDTFSERERRQLKIKGYFKFNKPHIRDRLHHILMQGMGKWDR